MARQLTESESVTPAGAALKVDPDLGVIYGVKVLGRESPNRYGVPGSEGTEYAEAGMRAALPLYEGAKVRADHPDRRNPAADRGVDETLGVLRSPRMDPDGTGVRADLHYLKAHPLAGRLVEDVERGLGVFALSHNATAGRERFDRGRKKLVIESIAVVRGVDLVDRGATTRNLAESEHVTTPTTTTMRALLESQAKRWSKGRKLWADALLEMDDMSGPIDAPVDAPAAETDPDEALKSGFLAAIMAVVNDDSLDAAAKAKKIGQLLKTHEKLTQDAEPEPPADDSDGGTAVTESEDAAAAAAELARLRAEKAVRTLCESMEFAPTELQVESLVGLGTDAKRKRLVESFKAAATPAKPGAPGPRSKAPGAPPARPGRAVAESAEDVAADLALLRR